MKLLLDFDKRFPGTHTIMMLENHRSVPQVLAVANSLIAKNHMRIPKDLVAARRSFGPTVWHHAVSPQAEAAWIAKAWLHCIARGLLIAIWRCCIARITHRVRSRRRF